MAWLKGLAGKAEDFLNQIDHNAAVALHGGEKKNTSPNTPLTEVTWESPSAKPALRESPTILTGKWVPPTPPAIPSVRSSPNLNTLSPARSPKPKSDDDLIKFLNSSEPSEPREMQQEVFTPQPITSTLPVPGSNHFIPVQYETVHEKQPSVPSVESSKSSSRRSSPQEVLSEQASQIRPQPTPPPQIQPQSETVVVPVVENSSSGTLFNKRLSDLETENDMLRNELRSTSNEMSLLLHRARTAEKEFSDLQKTVSQLQERADHINQLEQELLSARQQVIALQENLQSLREENEKLLQASTASAGSQNEALRTLQEDMEALQNKHRQEITTFESRLSGAERERVALGEQLAEAQQQANQRASTASALQQQLERARLEAQEAREELEQYRLRAQRILQDKEKLINRLRGEGGVGEAGSSGEEEESGVLELRQLRTERELLREETAQVTARLAAVRTELLEAEKRLELSREHAAEAQRQLQENLMEERRRRQAAEEDCKTHAEELRSVRDELSRQRGLLASRVREREVELTRLRTQLAQRPASPTDDELESRLHALTQALVQKQSVLETTTTEKNALRLQLEKMEKKHQEMVTLMSQNQTGIINVNDTDDAKAQIPSIFVETPFDTGMTRRVKRAYSSLDAVSIRTGVFLRRYPLARILVLCYMVLLHLWVMLVLFTYTPSAQ